MSRTRLLKDGIATEIPRVVGGGSAAGERDNAAPRCTHRSSPHRTSSSKEGRGARSSFAPRKRARRASLVKPEVIVAPRYSHNLDPKLI